MVDQDGASEKVVLTARIDRVRADAKAEAAERAGQRVADVAEQAIQQTGEAIDRARVIEKVSVQMDALMYRLAVEPPKPPRGRHARAGERQPPMDDLGEALGQEVR